ncbi:hypothetical protein PybrP1_002505 [[Pythium] brassicae (nom. inval.)]|nr:hypothetical protein PybrP1_002505 [[Pythium] brassicae (nom. inval.)]
MAQFVPLCTCASGGAGERELRLRGAGIDLLESERLASRRIALVAVLQVEDDVAAAPEFTGERGVYVSAHAENAGEQDASALTLILRGVDLQKEPFWGSLLVLLSSHLFVAHTGPVTSASFGAMAFLSHLMQVQVLDNGADDAKPEHNTMLLRDLVPRFTWAAIDLKQKDMDGCESPSKYFEQRLTSPSKRGFDVDAQMLMHALLHTRDCLVLKSNSLQTPEGFATPQAVTSSKLLTHALEGLQPKHFFGRYVNGSLLLHLLRSMAAAIASLHGSRFVLQRVVNNVYINFWKTLVNAAFVKYTDALHARLGVYEKVPFDAKYLLDITEHKLQSQQVAVVNAGQGKFSAFDEFGNLKRQASTDSHDGSGAGAAGASASPTGTTLNTGIFTFLKERAERAFTKQFSLFENTSMAAAKRGGASNLAHVPECDGDDDGDGDGNGASRLTNTRATVKLTPDDVLAQCNAPIKAYSIPMAYMNVASESMPVDSATLERIHREALDEAKAVIVPFLFGLRCTSVRYSEFVCTLNFNVGKNNLLRRVAQVKRRFERANEAASALFCAELIRCLHAIVLSKNERDKESQKRTPMMRRNTLSVMHLTGANGKDVGPPLTKLPVDLLTYKNNLEALVSQYNFVARGPLAAKVMIAFFQTAVRSRLLQIAQKEYERFDQVCDSKRDKLEELEEALETQLKSVKQVESVNAELSMQEARLIAEIEHEFQREAATLERAIREANDKVESALLDQQALYQSTMQATRKTINTMDEVVVKNRLHLGYLKRFEKGHLFSKSWRQYFYVLDNATLRCYDSKSAYEERKPPIEAPICLTGYNVIKSRTDEMKIKLIPPEAGRMLRFRAPVSVGRETWMKRFMEAAQLSESNR